MEAQQHKGNEMKEVASKLTCAQIKGWLLDNAANTSIDSLVFGAMLEALEEKTSEKDFVCFCAEMESSM